MRRAAALSVVALAVLVLGACGGGSSKSSSSSGSSGTVNVTEKEYAIALSSKTIKAGKVHFEVKNEGGMPHELVLFKTTLAANALPVKEGKVDEEGQGLEHIEQEAEDIAPGQTKPLDAELTAGSYVAVCNIAGHYQLGMRTAFTVQ